MFESAEQVFKCFVNDTRLESGTSDAGMFYYKRLCSLSITLLYIEWIEKVKETLFDMHSILVIALLLN